MKNFFLLFLSVIFIYSCNDDTEDNTPTVSITENIAYNETSDGNLSNSSVMPTIVTFTAGDNIIISNQDPSNADYFTFTIPEDYELSEINVEDFDISDPAFIGIAMGTSINGQSAEDLLGGLVYGQDDIDTNILPEMGTLLDATGFTGVLSSGEYSIWLNQTGSLSSVTLNFKITSVN